MLQIRSTQKPSQIEFGLRVAAERHGGSVLAVSCAAGEPASGEAEAYTFTLCFSSLYAPLLDADLRFAVFLPSRVAVCRHRDGVFLEAISPREYCRMLHRPEAEPLAESLEETLREVMEEAAQPGLHPAARPPIEHLATEDQVNMRAALPQRIDCHGSKVEDVAGTGVHDAQGG